MPSSVTPPPRLGTLRHRVAEMFTGSLTDHLPLKAVALFLTLVLWMVVRVKEPSDEFVPVRFEPSLDNSLVMRGQRPVVRALVIGSGQDILKLYRNPPVIRKVVDGDAPDELHLELSPEDVDIPPDVPVIVRDVQPRTVTLHFQSEATRTLPVRSALRFVADSGMTAGAPVLAPDSVTVTGDRRVVGKLEAVSTVANDLVVHESMDLVVPLDTGNLGVRVVSPTAVRVTVPVRRSTPPPPSEAAPRRAGRPGGTR